MAVCTPARTSGRVLPPLRPPAGLDLLTTTYRPRDAQLGLYHHVVNLVHERVPPADGVRAHISLDDIYLYTAALGGRIGKSTKTSHVRIGTLRTVRTGGETPGEYVDENNVWHFLLPKGWSTDRRDLRRSYALIATTSRTDLDAHIEVLLPESDTVEAIPTVDTYRDLRLTDMWDFWKLSDLSTHPATHARWLTAWDTVVARVHPARALLHRVLHIEKMDTVALLAEEIGIGGHGWLDPTGLCTAGAVSNQARARQWQHQLRRECENSPTRLLPTRLAHLSDQAWLKLVDEINPPGTVVDV